MHLFFGRYDTVYLGVKSFGQNWFDTIDSAWHNHLFWITSFTEGI